MLTVMCPNCRHRFPAPGCCEPADKIQCEKKRSSSNDMVHPSACYYGGGLLVPRGYTSGGGCFINAPTIVHGPAIIQTGGQQCSTNTIGNMDPSKYLQKIQRETRKSVEPRDSHCRPSECHVATTCDLTGGTVTITTPSIQSGGCLIQSTDSGILVQAPQIEIRPKLSGGGCLVQKRVDEQNVDSVLTSEDCSSESKYADELMNSCCNVLKSHAHRMLLLPPSGCQELPGTRRNVTKNLNPPNDEHLMQDVGELSNCVNEDEDSRYGFEVTSSPDVQIHTRMFTKDDAKHQNKENEQQQVLGHRDSCQEQLFRPQSRRSCCCNVPNLCQSHTGPASHSGIPNNTNSVNNLSENTFSKRLDNRDSLQIQVNATVQLPASLGQCTVNITATTAANNSSSAPSTRARNNFNGGGLVESAPTSNHVISTNERRDGAPTTPVSWLMPCPWSFDTYFVDKEVARLCEVKRLLQICGWYHEGLSWQQSESLLKDAPVGRWLMRDSSDSRYTFAVSVQTARGPTSVRVHYFLGKFRLDAEPRLALAMPMFDCPIKMLEHYVEYSKRMDEHRREVWVDYSGQLYSQIYLTKPLVKEVRSLAHLARLAVNRNKLPTEHLPPLIKNYIAEYPYTL